MVRYLRVEFKPKHSRYTECINFSISPPRRLVTAAVDFPMMPTAERNDEFVAHFAG